MNEIFDKLIFLKIFVGCANISKFALTIKTSCFHNRFLTLIKNYIGAHGA